MVKGLVCLLTLLLAACSAGPATRTELVLVADTDISLDRIEFSVEGAGKPPQRAEVAVSKASPPPHSLGVLDATGSRALLTLTATGYAGGLSIVSRQARVAFVPGKTVIVPLHLVWSCHLVKCEKRGDTCTERGCETATLDGAQLQTWSGQLPRLEKTPLDDAGNLADAAVGFIDSGSMRRDAGGMRSDAGMSDKEAGTAQPDAGITPTDAGTSGVDAGPPVCSVTQLDCDPGILGCETDVRTSHEHCGQCNHGCNNKWTCVDGQCTK